MVFTDNILKHIRQFYLLGMLLFSFSTVEAQLNLVPNPSFEVYDSCPYSIPATIYKGIEYAVPWFQPNIIDNSTDYFNACDTNNYLCGTPTNYEGFQTARTGVGYGGFVSGFITLFDPYREYLEIEFTDTLTNGHKYCVSFYVSYANNSDRSTDNISAYLSTNIIVTNDYLRLNYVPQINSPVGVVIDDTLNWVQVYGEYIATGGERFMTIGNFSTDSNTTLVFNNYGTHPYAYYYIDDVSVIDCTTTGIPDSNLGNDLELYPNPVADILNLKFENTSTSFHDLSLSDLTGKIILQKHFSSEKEIQLNLSEFPPGMYFLRVEDGSGCTTKKIIKV